MCTRRNVFPNRINAEECGQMAHDDIPSPSPPNADLYLTAAAAVVETVQLWVLFWTMLVGF